MKIAIYAIAKDEAAHAERFMAAAAGADHVLIADTGSQDDTAARLRAAGAEVHSLAVRPWRFDQARNLALSLVPDDVDICMALDLDEILPAGWRAAVEAAWQPGVTRLRYRYVWSHGADGDPDICFWADKIHARHGYRWEHPVHEMLVPAGAERFATAALQIDHYPDDAKPRSGYLPLLELAVAERPNSVSHTFYLGREYIFHQRWRPAIAMLTRYLDLPGAAWPPERAAAMRYLAQASRALGRWDAALDWLKRACDAAPGEREGWVDLAQACHDAQSWADGYAAALAALAIATRPDHYLTQGYAWGERADDLAAICAWNLGRRAAARMHIARARRMAPDDQRIAANAGLMEADPAGLRQAHGAPRISAALIVKNEEHALGRCLQSIQGHVDEIIVVDTGSDDQTREVARQYTDRVLEFPWRKDFAAARQYSFDHASGDWVLWLDADDVVLNADKIRARLQSAPSNLACVWWKYIYSRDEYGHPTCEFWRERCVRNDGSFRWQGRVHEFLATQGPHQSVRDADVVVVHHREPERGLRNAQRNIEILLDEYEHAVGAPEPRLLLYIGNEYTSLGDIDQGIAFFERYIGLSSWDDEKYMTQVRIAALYRQQQQFDRAIDADLQALKLHPHWPNAYFSLAQTYYFLGDWQRVIHWAQIGRSMPAPDTCCIANPMDYTYNWIIHYTIALYHTGAVREADEWTRRALELCPDDPQHQHNLGFFAHSLYSGVQND